jgi:RNA polymerase sigma-70 factor (ECF subfamily)
VARRTLANERRKRHDLPLDQEPSYEPEPVGDHRLAAAFAALSDADREILCLVAWEGLPFRDVARVLDVSPVAARVRFHRAKARLREELDGAASFRPETRGVTE